MAAIDYKLAMESYSIRQVADDFNWSAAVQPWSCLQSLHIGHYLWLHNGYTPAVEVKLCYSALFLYVRFYVPETLVRATYHTFQAPVYRDSCVEFFIDPFPAKQIGYINFEFNALGTMLAAIGRDRSQRTALTWADCQHIGVAAPFYTANDLHHCERGWQISYRIPLQLFSRYYHADIGPGTVARGNFYKCGDDTVLPHYGAWRPVLTPKPDFHQPDYFGSLIFT